LVLTVIVTAGPLTVTEQQLAVGVAEVAAPLTPAVSVRTAKASAAAGATARNARAAQLRVMDG
jgi:hypothetical protein